MKPAPLDYLAPTTLAEVLALKAQHGEEAKFLAGGQSLIPALNFRMALASILVDVNGLTDLAYLQSTPEGGLRIGALTRQRQLERDTLVRQHAPLLHEAVPFIAHPQIRNRGTVGGSLAHADPAAELPVIMLALNARFRAQSAQGERWIDAADFFKGFFSTALNADEMLVEVALPPMPARTGYAFMEFARRKGDYALMGVAAIVSLNEQGVCEHARLVYLNAGDGPMNAPAAAKVLLGQVPTSEAIAAVAAAVDAEISPAGNVHATAAYQRHLAKVLTKRALTKATERAVISSQ